MLAVEDDCRYAMAVDSFSEAVMRQKETVERDRESSAPERM